jgi:uncharacterized protein YkwD
MNKLAIRLVSIVISLVTFLATALPSQAYTTQELLNEVNQVRLEHHLSPLTTHSALESSCKVKLADLRQFQYWDHNNPDTGASWVESFLGAGIGGEIGENLARDFDSPEQVVLAWLNSPAHRDNLLNPTFSHLAITLGTVNYPDGASPVVVAHFASSQTDSRPWSPLLTYVANWFSS